MDAGRPSIKSTRSVRSNITDGVEKRMGKTPLLGRYHEMPRQMDQDFVFTGKVLGSGLNGEVKMAVRRDSLNPDEAFAVKEFNLAKMSRKAAVSLESEVQIFLCLDHPHICRLVNVYQTPHSLSLVMECMAGGELFDRVTSAKKFPERQAAQALDQMLLAVHYLHCHGIVHRDLKLENFVYDKKDGDLLKLIDFGFSKFRERGAKMKTACGTLAYVAPEVLTDTYTSQCDLWSFGVIVFILLSGSMPFKGNSSNVKGKIVAADFVMPNEKWKNISKDGVAFTKALLQKDPEVRLTAKQALDHPWIQSHRKQATVVPDSSMLKAFHDYSGAPKFRRCCLLAMAWLLTSSETEKIREEFCAIDTDRQGTISMKEFKAIMLHNFQIAEKDVVNIFRAIDVNHDDEIHYSEFLAAMLSTRITVNDKLVQSTFRNFDKDLSGYITTDNLRDAFGNAFEGQGVENLLQEVDVSRDGRISYPEFAAYVRGTPVQQNGPRLSYVPRKPSRNLQNTAKRTEVEGVQQPCCSIM